VAPEPVTKAEPQSALRGYTDQFEVLRLPKGPINPPTTA
jgi:hypothetical protein